MMKSLPNTLGPLHQEVSFGQKVAALWLNLLLECGDKGGVKSLWDGGAEGRVWTLPLLISALICLKLYEVAPKNSLPHNNNRATCMKCTRVLWQSCYHSPSISALLFTFFGCKLSDWIFIPPNRASFHPFLDKSKNFLHETVSQKKLHRLIPPLGVVGTYTFPWTESDTDVPMPPSVRYFAIRFKENEGSPTRERERERERGGILQSIPDKSKNQFHYCNFYIVFCNSWIRHCLFKTTSPISSLSVFWASCDEN